MPKRATQSLGHRLDVAQRQEFVRSSLPLTIELADVLKAILIPHLREMPQDWPYPDRVLAWLVPSLSDDIRRFHGGGGKPLQELVPGEAVRHLDHDFLDLLAKKAEAIRPGVVRLLQELSSFPREDA